MTLPGAQWIDTDQQLQDNCQHWLTEPYLAVDTEFVRTSTFYPQAGLIQIADSRGCFLIDPLLIQQWQPLADVFQHPAVTKVFHACAEDLEVCRCLLGCIPQPLADTQHGIALTGLGSSMGFQRAVSAVLNIDIEKDETRSNWLERPLRSEQINYAVADVYYLYQLYPELIRRLKQQDREHWLVEDCQRLVSSAQQPDDIQQHYRKIKLAWKLRLQEQFLLQQLVIWREEQARERDVPRNRLITDAALWNIARYKSKNKEQLIKAGVRPACVKADGKALLQIVSWSLAQDKHQWPTLLDKPFTPQLGQTLKDLKHLVAKQAQVLNIPADVLVKKKDLEQLIRSGLNGHDFTLPDTLLGWRKILIGQPLLQYLQQDPQQVPDHHLPNHHLIDE